VGTNFYTDRKNTQHIGKRSAAGLYCWDCGVTLCRGGEPGIHQGGPRVVGSAGLRPGVNTQDPNWYTECPRCGQKKTSSKNDWIKSGPVAVELGFAEPELTRPKGVTGCSSFTWAMRPEAFLVRRPNTLVWDEYGRRMTHREFVQMIDLNCPARFLNMIGRDFS
jgi:hypothetical protein